MIPYTYAFANGLSPFDAEFSKLSGSIVQSGSEHLLSAARRIARAMKTAQRKEARELAQATPKQHPIHAPKAPSVRPFQAPVPAKAKRAPRPITTIDGRNVLNRIRDHKEGGDDLIAAMRDSTQAPEELAERLLIEEIGVIEALNASRTKDRKGLLLVAIGQAAAHLDNSRPQIVGVQKQQRLDAVQAEQEKRTSLKKKPKVRTFVVPTVEELVPKKTDSEIVLDELKQYLGHNARLGKRVMDALSDVKASQILEHGVGPRFDAKVKGLLATPLRYPALLTEASTTLRCDMRKYDATETSKSAVQEGTEVSAEQEPGRDAWERYLRRTSDAQKASTPVEDTSDEDLETQERHLRQMESLARFAADNPKP